MEVGHPAHARFSRLALELHSLGLELGSRSVHVGDAQRHAAEVGRKRLALAGRVEDVERYLPHPELHVVLSFGLDLEPESLGVEALCAGDVLRQERHEVDVLDFDHGVEPSWYGL